MTQSPQSFPQPNKTTLDELFKPLNPSQGSAVPGPEATPIAAAAGEKHPDGTVTVDDLLAGSKHTEISSINGINGATGPQAATGAPGNPVNLGGMVQGEWVVNIVDALLPSLLVAGLYAAGIKVRKTELQLTSGEKSTLAPLWNKCLESILLNFDSPWSALALTMVAIYGGKLAEKGLVSLIDKKQEKQQAEVLKSKIEAAEAFKEPDPKNDYTNQPMADIIAGRVITPADNLPFDENEVRRRMESGKMGRSKAIEALKKKYKVK